jgi:hypothetical protein
MRATVRTIGQAEGSIIAAIITAHMANTASTLAGVQRGEAGMVSCASGCAMSSASQASAAQENSATASTPAARVCGRGAKGACGRSMLTSVPRDRRRRAAAAPLS